MRSHLTYLFTFPIVIISCPVSLSAQTSNPVAHNKHPLISIDSGNSTIRTNTLVAQASGVEEYKIQLERPYTVGDVFSFSTRGTESLNYAVLQNDQELEQAQESSTLELQANVTVLDVNLTQQMTRVSFEIIQSRLIEGVSESVPFPQGANMLAFVQDGDTVFEIDGEVIEGDLEGILSVAIDLLDEGGPDDDEVFGTSNSQKIGDSWTIDSEAASVIFDGIGPQDISGSTTLNNVEDEILFVSGSMNIDNGLSPILEQDEFIVQDDITVVEFAIKLPTEELDGNFDRSTSLTSSISANHKDNLQLRVEMVYEASISSQLRSVE